jgi:serine/threonine protein kinase
VRRDDDPTLSQSRYPDPDALGPFKIEARVATGAVTIVYRATDTRSGETVCAKLLKPPHDEDDEAVERFFAGANAAKAFAHPALVKVREVGREAGRPYLVMDFVPGEDGARIVGRDGPQAPRRVAGWLAQAAAALEQAGIPHGDLRPRHFVIDDEDTIRLVGFGQSAVWHSASGQALVGDASYLAPEIGRGQERDYRADIYALACAGYEMLTGKTPFGAGAPNALLACHTLEPFPRVSSAIGPMGEPFDELLRSMAAKSPNLRPKSWGEVKTAFVRLAATASEVSPGGPSLLVDVGRQRGQKIPLPEGELILGRLEDEGFVIDDAQVSRRHAAVDRRGGAITVRDLGSKNGIQVNGATVTAGELNPGDRLTIGDTILVLTLPDMGPATTNPPTSPVRGAFGVKEVMHPPSVQLDLNAPPPLAGRDLLVQRNILTGVAQLLGQEIGGVAEMRDQIIGVVRDNLGADAALLVPVELGKLAPDIRTAEEANLLSRVLPALERALPGQLSLRTTVRADRDEALAVMCAPVIGLEGSLVAYLAVAGSEVVLEEGALRGLEAAAALLSIRARRG